MYDFMLNTKPRIVVIGDIILDNYLSGSCDRISPEAPVPVVDVKEEKYTLGGCGNVAANLASLGVEVTLITVLGSDDSSHMVTHMLHDLGINSSGIVFSSYRKTSKKTRVVVNNQQIVRFDVESRNEIEKSEEVSLLGALKDALDVGNKDAIILSDYGKGSLTESLIQDIIFLASQLNIPVTCDPKGADFSRYRGCTVITPNRKEASLASGLPINDSASLKLAGQMLLKSCDLAFLIITLSEEGLALFKGEEIHIIPANVRSVFDVSGAGDTIIAALTFALSQNVDVVEACNFANVAAGIVVGKHGTSVVSRDEIVDLSAVIPLNSSSKYVSKEYLLAEIKTLKEKGNKIVFTNGCFDILHAGHIRFLEEAASFGDILIVGLNTDASVRRLKGDTRPVNHDQDRASVLGALQSVAYVVPFSEDTPLELISDLLPDVLVKGADYSVDTVVGSDIVLNNGGDVRLVDLVDGLSTTNTIVKINKIKR